MTAARTRLRGRRVPLSKSLGSSVGVKRSAADGGYEEEEDTDYGEDSDNADGAYGDVNLAGADSSKELIMWASRLELESIDLRDKSSGLIGELARNSGIMRNASIDLKSAVDSWNKVNAALRGQPGMKNTLDQIRQSVDSLPGGCRGVISLNAIKLFHKKVSSFTNGFDRQLRSSIKQAVDDSLSVQVKGRKKTTILNTLMDKLDACSNQMREINDTQIAVLKAINTLSKSHRDMDSKLDSLSRITHAQGQPIPTPNSTLIVPSSRYSTSLPSSQMLIQSRKRTGGYEQRRLQINNAMIKSRKRDNQSNTGEKTWHNVY